MNLTLTVMKKVSPWEGGGTEEVAIYMWVEFCVQCKH